MNPLTQPRTTPLPLFITFGLNFYALLPQSESGVTCVERRGGAIWPH
jgi:hypothetical protein